MSSYLLVELKRIYEELHSIKLKTYCGIIEKEGEQITDIWNIIKDINEITRDIVNDIVEELIDKNIN
jgi:hypothetical protein